MDNPAAIAPITNIDIASLLPRALLPSTTVAALLVAPANSVSVEISGLGRVLSAVSIFSDSLAPLQAGGVAQNFGTDVAGAAAAAQSLVDAFNNLQNTLGAIRTSSVAGVSGGILAANISLGLTAQEAAPFGNGALPLTGLAQIGIVAAAGGQGGPLRLDVPTLEAAFANNQQGTLSLLEQAAQSFGTQVAGVAVDAARIGSTTALIGILGSLGGASGQSLLGTSLNAQLGLADLLSLEAATEGNSTAATTPARQAQALNQYSLVASLLSG